VFEEEVSVSRRSPEDGEKVFRVHHFRQGL
jgi:hypothetical protein